MKKDNSQPSKLDPSRDSSGDGSADPVGEASLDSSPANQLDELLLDRLVDNDLSDDEYRQVLSWVEEKPDGWRQLALAFLESQALEKELSSLQCEMEFRSESKWRTDRESQLSPAEEDVLRPAKPRVDKGPQGSPGGSSFRRSFPAIAACFTIAFVSVVYFWEGGDPRRGEEAGLPRDGVATQEAPQVGGEAVKPDYLELVSSNRDDRIRTPVYDHQEFDPSVLSREMDDLRPRLQNVVNQPGWKADEQTHVIPVRDRLGNKIILPLKEIQLTPNLYEDYQ
ncbi:MAG: hypothetical protein VX768_06205 [Planctomycetota bacterium]|nr:hypothetical protein [Planctomycetota bacterium]